MDTITSGLTHNEQKKNIYMKIFKPITPNCVLTHEIMSYDNYVTIMGGGGHIG